MIAALVLAGGMNWPAEGKLSREGLQRFFRRIEAAQKNSRGFLARMRNEKRSTLIEDVAVSKGRIWYEKPDKLRREVLSPSRSVLVLNGYKVWIYFPEEREGERFDLSRHRAGKQLDSYIHGLTFDLDEIEKIYDVLAEREKDPPYVRVELKTKEITDETVVKRTRLWFRQGCPWPVKWESTSVDDDVSLDEYTDVKLDVRTKEKLFREPRGCRRWNTPGE